MKLHLNLSLRRALLAAIATVGTLASTSHAGVLNSRYDLQHYRDFYYNKGLFAAGNTGINVLFKDGTGVSNPVIPLMPNMDSVATGYIHNVVIPGVYESYDRKGGANLFTAQYVSSAAHCGEVNIHFLREGNSLSTKYTSSGYTRCSLWETKADATYDWGVQRLNKLVTEVAYTPYATDEFIENLKAGDWLYRAGEGKAVSTDKTFSKNQEATGGLVDISEISRYNDEGRTCVIRTFLTDTDVAPPLEIGALKGDSGSPFFAWDDANDRFVQVAFASQSWETEGFGNDIYLKSNPTQLQNFIDSMTIEASGFNGEETIIWGAQDAATGKGTLSQGSTTVEYTGKGTGNGIKDTLALAFSTTDTQNEQVLEMQGSVNMGAGALIFENGKWKLTETAADHTLSSAGIEIKDGAELTWALTGTSSEEIRKVGEGILNISGSGDNEAKLVVGGGTTIYNVTRDDDGNITGCTLGNKGETRLNRTGGYAASSVRLEGGVAIVVLMGDNQFKINETGGDTFSFGNAGGLLNLNGHDLSWGIINQEGSGTGARIGNFTPEGERTPGKATFTYTGTGTFAGCFMDEGDGEDKAQLAVKYNSTGNTWKLTGNSTNAGGYTVEAGTLVLEGTNTPHVQNTDVHDWTFATMETSSVKVESGAKFQLSHHAQLRGNVDVTAGGVFELNQTANAASESISGMTRQDMESLGIASLIGNVALNGNASMIVDTDSPVSTIIQGSISGDATSTITKTGSGALRVIGEGAGFAGTISVQEGTLAAGSNLLSSASSITFTGGKLDLSDTTFTTDGTGISLSGALKVNDAQIELGSSIENTGTYVIFDLSGEGASLDSWDASKISLNGVNLLRYAGATLSRTEEAASISVSSMEMASFSDLQWSGGSSLTWDSKSTNWDSVGDGTDTHFTFVKGDGVIFNTSTDVTMAENISAGKVTIARPEGTAEGKAIRVSLNESAGALSAESIEVGSGASLVYETTKVDFVADNITGTGTVEINQLYDTEQGEGWGAQLKLAHFDGTTYIKAGKFDLYKATDEFTAGGNGTTTVDDNAALVGGTLHLGSGAHMQITGGKSVIINANMVIDTNTTGGVDSTIDGMEVHQNSNANLTINGTVTGKGIWCRKGGGTLAFTNTVDLGGFNTGGGTTNFNADTTLGTVSIAGGTTNLNGASTVTTLNHTNGNVNIGGKVEITGKLNGTGGTLAMKSGELKLSYTGEDGNTIRMLDGSVGGTAAGALRLAKDVKATVATQIWGRSQSSIVLEEDAELISTEDSISFTNKGAAKEASLVCSASDGEYGTSATNWTLTNGHAKSTATEDKTLGNKLVNVSVENAGTGTLTVSNAVSLTGLHATGGSIIMVNFTDADVDELEIASGRSITSSALTVNQLAKFAAASTLNADMVLASGATLELEGGMTLNGALSLQTGLTLSGAVLSEVLGLETGESYTLFTGVQNMQLQEMAMLYNLGALAGDAPQGLTFATAANGSQVAAGDYFTNLAATEGLVLNYDAGSGTVSITQTVPEPATAALSLLALAALSARRRKK